MSVTINGTNGLTFNDNTTQATSPFAGGLGFRNRIINGDMRIDQRNNGASVTQSSNAAVYYLDRWFCYSSAGSSRYSVQRNAGSVTPPAGFTNYLGITSLAANSPASGDVHIFGQKIEGFNAADFAWGTANAQPVTLSIRVYSSLTGTFSGAIYNSAGNRCYPFSYSVASANTWTTATVTIPGDTTGAWLTDSGTGLQAVFNLGSGSTYLGTAGSWGGTYYVGATGSVNVLGTNGATFYITGVQLEKGSTATSFDYRPYGTELMLCQRYYYKYASTTASVSLASGVNYTASLGLCYLQLPVTMRTAPTGVVNAAGNFAIIGGASGFVCSAVSFTTSVNSVRVEASVSGATVGHGNIFQFNNTSGAIEFSAEL